MVKHTQTIRRQTADELLSLFDHFVILAPKELICIHDHDKNIEKCLLISLKEEKDRRKCCGN